MPKVKKSFDENSLPRKVRKIAKNEDKLETNIQIADTSIQVPENIPMDDDTQIVGDIQAVSIDEKPEMRAPVHNPVAFTSDLGENYLIEFGTSDLVFKSKKNPKDMLFMTREQFGQLVQHEDTISSYLMMLKYKQTFAGSILPIYHVHLGGGDYMCAHVRYDLKGETILEIQSVEECIHLTIEDYGYFSQLIYTLSEYQRVCIDNAK